jgi:hypothetical protein
MGKSALHYELDMSILGGDLMWIQGPYPTGKFTDIKILNKVLRHFLDPGEQVKADEGFVGDLGLWPPPVDVQARYELVEWRLQVLAVVK